MMILILEARDPLFFGLMSLVASKHFIVYNSKMLSTGEERTLLSTRTFIRVAETTVTSCTCVCIIRYMYVVPSTKRWSISAITVNGILMILDVWQFSWSHSMWVDYAKQESFGAT